MSLYDQVFSHNKEWVQKQLQLNSGYFSEMAKNQAPDFLYIGCSDSRVSPDAFLGTARGGIHSSKYRQSGTQQRHQFAGRVAVCCREFDG